MKGRNGAYIRQLAFRFMEKKLVWMSMRRRNAEINSNFQYLFLPKEH